MSDTQQLALVSAGAVRRDARLDLLRIVAAVAVVTIHVSGIALGNSDRPAAWWVCNLFDAFSRWSVPIFVMISGAVLLPRALNEEPRAFVLARVGRIAIPLIF